MLTNEDSVTKNDLFVIKLTLR